MRQSLRALSASFMISLLLTPLAQGQTRNDIRSCYRLAEVDGYQQPAPRRELVVLIDQTVRLDPKLKKSVHSHVERFIQPGDALQLVSFSAMTSGRYTDVLFKGQFDYPLPQGNRDSMNRLKLAEFDRCLTAQPQAFKLVHRQIKSAFHDEQQRYPKTELAGTLTTIGTELLAQSSAQRKVLLLVSDMFENSDALSFYQGGQLQRINAASALSKIQSTGLRGNLQGAEVYVVGAGFVNGDSVYRSQQALNQLESFWSQLLKANNGNLVAFGKPMLLRDLR